MEAPGDPPGLVAPRPASTAWRIASAITSGSRASAMAVPTSTAWHPSSIARAASEAVPTPPATMTGTVTASRTRRDGVGVADPEAQAYWGGLEEDSCRASLLESPGRHRIVARHRQRDEPVPAEGAGRVENRREVRHLCLGIPDDVDRHDLTESCLSREVGRSHGLVRGPAPARGRDQREAVLIDRGQERAAGARELQLPEGDRDELRAGSLVALPHDLSRGVPLRSHDQP